MKSSTKKILAATGFLVAVSGPILASAGEGFGADGKMCDRAEARHAKYHKHAEQRLTALKNELKLTSAQEPAWQKFEQAMRKQFADRDESWQKIKESDDPMAARVAHMEQHLAGMKSVLQARDELYKTLSPEQKKVADQFFKEHRPSRT